MAHRSLNFSHPGHVNMVGVGMCSGKWLGNGKLLNIEFSYFAKIETLRHQCYSRPH